MEMNGNLDMMDIHEEELPRGLRSTYALWQAGRDLGQLMSRTKFYRDKAKLKSYGVDISLPVQSTEKKRIVLVDILTATPEDMGPDRFEQLLVNDQVFEIAA